jgi:hypothetical protein
MNASCPGGLETGALFSDGEIVMSLKYAAQKVSDNHSVLPKVGSMRWRRTPFSPRPSTKAPRRRCGSRSPAELYPIANIKGAD